MKKIFFHLKRKKYIISTLFLAIIILVILPTFAYFMITADNSKNEITNVQTGTMEITFEDGDNGINEALEFGKSVHKKFTLKNTGSLDAVVSMNWDKLINTYLNGSLTYNLTFSETEDGEYKEIIPESNIPTSKKAIEHPLANELSVETGKTYYYDLEITLNNLKDVDQTEDLSAMLSTNFTLGDPRMYIFYTLTVDPNGGTIEESSSIYEYKLLKGETLEIQTPVKEGYNFLGWELNGSSSTLENSIFTMGISNATLVAKWEEKTYNITIDSGDNRETRQIKFGDTIELISPSKEGHTFNNWTVTEGEIVDNTYTLRVPKDVTITANFTPNNYKYKVIHRTMTTNGSGYTTAETVIEEAPFGSEISPDVKNFTGFSSPEKQTMIIKVDNATPTINVITYNYTRNKYKLTIDGAGGNGSTEIEMFYGATRTINNPTRSGYTFAGWTVSGGTLNNTTFTMGDGDSKLTAKWTPNTYKYVTYHKQMDTNGTTYTLKDTVTGNANVDVTVTPPLKSYTGFTAPPTQSLKIQADSTTPTKNIVNYLYPRNKYTLTIDPNGGEYDGATGYTRIEAFYQTRQTLKTPIKPGYTFSSWSRLSGTLGSVNGNVFTVAAGNGTVKANWTANKYNYTINHYKMNLDGKTYTLAETETKQADYQSTVNASKKTYTGFTTPATKSIVIQIDTSKNVVDYYYTRNKYTLTIKPNGGSYDGYTTDITKSLYYEETLELSAPLKTGYTLSKWTVSSYCSITGNVVKMGNGTASITANWTANTYAITFNANGGTVNPESKTITFNTKYGDLPTPVYPKYEFLGWFTAPVGGTEITSNTNFTTASDQTIYAHWRELFNAVDAVIAIQNNETPKNIINNTPNFQETEKNDAGVRMSEDDYGKSYYYRGDIFYNYVKFAGYYWRIMRINGDGSVRMIYDGTSIHQNGERNVNRVLYENIAWNSNLDDNKYLGYMYGGASGTPSSKRINLGSEGYEDSENAIFNETDSNIKKTLENWYVNAIKNKGYDEFVADAIYCNDRSVPGKDLTGLTNDTGLGYGTNKTGYGTYHRLDYAHYSSSIAHKPRPNLKCTNKNDAFTLNETDKGNGKLGQKVGMITADEAIFAGGSISYSNINTSYYLYKGYQYYTLSAASYLTSPYYFVLNQTGGITHVTLTNNYAVAPVIALTPEYFSTFIGDGQAHDVYRAP